MFEAFGKGLWCARFKIGTHRGRQSAIDQLCKDADTHEDNGKQQDPHQTAFAEIA